MKSVFSFVSVICLVIVAIAAVAATPVLAKGPEAQPAGVHAAIVAQDEVPSAEGGVALPEDLKVVITFVIGLLVAQGVKSIFRMSGKDLSGYGAAFTAALANAVILFSNALLSLVPASAAPTVTVLLTLLITILASFGLKDTLKGFQVRY